LLASSAEVVAQGKTEVKATFSKSGPPPNGPFTIDATGTVEVATGDVFQGISFYVIDKNGNTFPGFTNYPNPKQPGPPVPGGGPIPVKGYCSQLLPGTYDSILVMEYLKGGNPPVVRFPASAKVTVP
jgi:hypothetical protein